MWHPSKLGHMLRAGKTLFLLSVMSLHCNSVEAHISFFWLSVLSDALRNVSAAIKVAATSASVQNDRNILINYKNGILVVKVLQ
jgi:hypothetical protein